MRGPIRLVRQVEFQAPLDCLAEQKAPVRTLLAQAGLPQSLDGR